MLKSPNIEEINDQGREMARAHLHDAIEHVPIAAGYLQSLGAYERANELLRITRNLQAIHDTL